MTRNGEILAVRKTQVKNKMQRACIQLTGFRFRWRPCFWTLTIWNSCELHDTIRLDINTSRILTWVQIADGDVYEVASDHRTDRLVRHPSIARSDTTPSSLNHARSITISDISEPGTLTPCSLDSLFVFPSISFQSNGKIIQSRSWTRR